MNKIPLMGQVVYVLESINHTVVRPCRFCDKTGKVKLKGKLFHCPACMGMGKTTKQRTVDWRIHGPMEVACIEARLDNDGLSGHVYFDCDYAAAEICDIFPMEAAALVERDRRRDAKSE